MSTGRLDDMDRPDLLRFVAGLLDEQSATAPPLLADELGASAGWALGCQGGYTASARTLRAIADEMVAPPLPVRTMQISPDAVVDEAAR